ncbi:MAG: UDP-N-acetylmuramoyl-tripeptide--D-alanyl-D-alanine ligase [Muribaculaceae bacterium]|nr:UDP-N-acetylmuramoyl-tripeptide--D-alanyl-D-alanine ligase [Muribaculaceae bacterium]
MTTPAFITFAIMLLAGLVFLGLMLRWDMQMLQQNSYFASRYWRWLTQSQEGTTVKRLVMMAIMVALVVPFVYNSYYNIALLTLCIVGLIASDLRKKYKLPLKYTKRVKMQFATALLLCIAVVAAVVSREGWLNGCRVTVALTIISPFITLLINWILTPYRRWEQNKFLNMAKEKLAGMPQLTVVGITGSYGKTSTRTFLGKILSEQYSVCLPPGNFNTTLGVVRTINEVLRPYDQVYVCEMGAKNVGDIKEICDIVRPKFGIVTAVGEMHLETFKTPENVQRTKFELVDALPSDGMAIINNDWPLVASRDVSNVPTLRYAMNEGEQVDYNVEDLSYNERGTHFTVVGGDTRIQLTTKLVGESNISNLMAAVIMAIQLDVPQEKIQYAVSRIEQVEHRLSMKRAGGITIIDDAYNSNPTGSRMALDVLSQMPGTHFVITPGMIELGKMQEQRNREFGEHIAKTADVAIIVGEYNRDAIVSGIQAAGFNPDRLHTVATFTEGYALMLSLAQQGDTVLLENDLPDTFK